MSYLPGDVALRAELVAGELQLERMRIVAIGAADAVGVHLALEERAVFVDLVENLAVVVVQAGGEQRRARSNPAAADRGGSRRGSCGGASGTWRRFRFATVVSALLRFARP